MTGGTMGHTYRLWNDKRGEYRWIHLDSSVKTQADDSRLLYGVYSDVSEQRHLEGELVYANEKMQDIVNAIPGGVAIYKMTNIFETKYFSDGLAGDDRLLGGRIPGAGQEGRGRTGLLGGYLQGGGKGVEGHRHP